MLKLPCWSGGKESACNAGDKGSVPGLRRSPGREMEPTPVSLSGKNPTDRGAWQAMAQRVTKELDTTEQLKITGAKHRLLLT